MYLVGWFDRFECSHATMSPESKLVPRRCNIIGLVPLRFAVTLWFREPYTIANTYNRKHTLDLIPLETNTNVYACITRSFSVSEFILFHLLSRWIYSNKLQVLARSECIQSIQEHADQNSSRRSFTRCCCNWHSSHCHTELCSLGHPRLHMKPPPRKGRKALCILQC